MKIPKKKKWWGGGEGGWGVGLGAQGGCERRSEVFVKIQKKNIFFFFFVWGGGGGRVGGGPIRGWGGGGWVARFGVDG